MTAKTPLPKLGLPFNGSPSSLNSEAELVYVAERIVQTIYDMHMPAVEVRKRVLLPAFSTTRAPRTAVKRL
jgi:hypothetical protein